MEKSILLGLEKSQNNTILGLILNLSFIVIFSRHIPKFLLNVYFLKLNLTENISPTWSGPQLAMFPSPLRHNILTVGQGSISRPNKPLTSASNNVKSPPHLWLMSCNKIKKSHQKELSEKVPIQQL